MSVKSRKIVPLSYLYQTIDSPIGSLTIYEQSEKIVRLTFDNISPINFDKASCIEKSSPLLEMAKTQLIEYFKGERKTFTLKLAMLSTNFRQKVHLGLCNIPYGTTKSYAQLAVDIGYSKSYSRAVGSANGKNDIPIFIPCHRVIQANGTLGGFIQGNNKNALHIKQSLLELEQKYS